ncbi:uncharacterized protein LOC126979989 [Leptidea sinapis]|nr:uncharacterized protein LOC126979989 [Leptidea sinapis]
MDLSVALPFGEGATENFNSFSHIIDIAGLSQSQSSPSPSISSESSGIGSLGSLKSESVNNDSLPSSPHTDKKLFEGFVQPQPRPKEDQNVKVIYGGRDILNLMGNLGDSRWNYRATVLPPNNPALFFANRSQYHRLGPFGTRTQYVHDSCQDCGFSWVVAAIE